MQGNHLQLFFVAAVFLCNVYSVSGKEDIRSALIIVDVQECFLPGGSLAVANGAAIIPVINSIRENNTFEMVVFTMDWHLPGHVSFASTHNKSVGATVPLRYLKNGYETYTVVDAAIGIDPKHVEDAKQKLSDKGVHLIKHTDIQDILKNHSPRLFAHCLVFTLVCSVVSRKLVLHWLMD
uniref:Isochorismatase-like domain-containing protein n=1 Tax=Arion vulgaris TaxID=1028688 RepID=A0A0B7BFT6_9EUPU